MEEESTVAFTPALFSAVDLNPGALSPTSQRAETPGSSSGVGHRWCRGKHGSPSEVCIAVAVSGRHLVNCHFFDVNKH